MDKGIIMKIIKLNKILNFYNKKYKLKTIMKNNKNTSLACYNIKKNKIYINFSNITKCKPDIQYLQKIPLKKDIDFYIAVLLHEIGHAVDYKKNPKRFNNEWADTDLFLYESLFDYGANRPFEKRAIRFANKEIKRWI